MAAEAEQVDAQLRHRQGDVAGGLGGIHVQQHAAALAEGGDRGQGLEHADLVVGGHHADQQHVVAQGRLEPGQIHQAIGRHRQQLQGEAVAAQIGQGVEHGPVLTHQAQQAPPRFALLQGQLAGSLEGQVVGLGGAAGEDHRLRKGA